MYFSFSILILFFILLLFVVDFVDPHINSAWYIGCLQQTASIRNGKCRCCVQHPFLWKPLKPFNETNITKIGCGVDFGAIHSCYSILAIISTDCVLGNQCYTLTFYCILLAVKCGKSPLIIHSRSIYIKTCLISCCFLYIRVLVGYIIQYLLRKLTESRNTLNGLHWVKATTDQIPCTFHPVECLKNEFFFSLEW